MNPEDLFPDRPLAALAPILRRPVAHGRGVSEQALKKEPGPQVGSGFGIVLLHAGEVKHHDRHH